MSYFTPVGVRTTPMSDFVSPSTRRRRAGIAASTSTPPVFLDSISRNDDGAEKRQRILSSTTSTALNSPATPRTASRIGNERDRQQLVAPSGSDGLTNHQIKDLYTNCVQLSVSNKITAKNAFGLHLIDYMHDLIRNIQEGETTNFQVAGCTLDASAKIYAGRVDSIHIQAYKMLGGLGRAEKDRDVDEEGVSGDKENETGPQKKKKDYRAKQGSKIEKNIEALNVKQFDLEFEVDPLFHKTSAAFDEGGVKGLLLNHLSVRDDTCELLLDSTAVIAPQNTTTLAQSQQQKSMVDLSEYRDLCSKITSDTVKICPHFADFEFTNWNRNETTTSNFKEMDAGDGNCNSAYAFDVNAPTVLENVFDHPGMAGGEFSDDDDGDGMMGGDMEFGREGCAAEGQANHMMGNVTLAFADGQEARLLNPSQAKLMNSIPDSATTALGSLCLELSEQPSEYSYFKTESLANWMKMRQKKNFAARSTLGPKKKTRAKKVVKSPFENSDIDFEKSFCRKRAATVLSKATVKKMSSDKTTLKDHLEYGADDLVRMLAKTKMLVRRQVVMLSSDGDWSNVDNEGDEKNYCPDLEEGDDDDCNGVCDGGSFGVAAMGDGESQDTTSDMTQSSQGLSFNNTTLGDQTMFAGDGLVAQPNRVAKIDIGYAKSAKKMDVRKLKSTMWNILTAIETEENKENVPVDGECQQEKTTPKNTEEITNPYPFDQLYAQLKSQLPKHMAKNLTPHIGFVCILHLANEKCLKLTGGNAMENFVITQGI